MKTLKKLQILFISMSMVCISCSNDDDAETFNERTVIDITKKSQLYGIWKYESITVERAVDLNGDGIENTDLLLEIPSCVLDDIYTINSNDTYEILDNNVCGNDLQRSFYGPNGSYVINDNITNEENKQIDLAFNFEESENDFEGFDWRLIKELYDTNTPNKRYLKFRFEYRDLGLERPSNFTQSIDAVMVSDNEL